MIRSSPLFLIIPLTFLRSAIDTANDYKKATNEAAAAPSLLRECSNDRPGIPFDPLDAPILR